MDVELESRKKSRKDARLRSDSRENPMENPGKGHKVSFEERPGEFVEGEGHSPGLNRSENSNPSIENVEVLKTGTKFPENTPLPTVASRTRNAFNESLTSQTTIGKENLSINLTASVKSQLKKAYMKKLDLVMDEPKKQAVFWLLFFLFFVTVQDSRIITGIGRALAQAKSAELEDLHRDIAKFSQFVYIVSGVYFGYVGDWRGRKYLLLVTIAVWNAANLQLVVSTDAMLTRTAMYLSTISSGCEAGTRIVVTAIIADLFVAGDRLKYFSVFYLHLPLTDGIGLVMQANVTSLVRKSYLVVVSSLPAIGVVLLLYVPIMVDPFKGMADGMAIASSSPTLRDILVIFNQKTFVLTTSACVCTAYTKKVLLSELPRHLTRGNPEKIVLLYFGLAMMFAGTAGLLAAFFSAKLARQRRSTLDPLVCGLGLILSGLCLFLLVALNRYRPALWIMLILALFFSSFSIALQMDVLTYTVHYNRRSMAIALQVFMSVLFGRHLIDMSLRENYTGIGVEARDRTTLHSAVMLSASVSAILGGALFCMACSTVDADRRQCHGYLAAMCALGGKYSREYVKANRQVQNFGSANDSEKNESP